MVVVLSVGMVGNALSFAIFFRANRKRGDPSIFYLTCLSVADTGVIISRGWMEWINYGLGHITNGKVSFNVYLHSRLSCKIIPFLMQFTMCISAWIIVSFSLERAYVVWFPLKRAEITPAVRKRVIIVLNVAMLLGAIHRLALLEIIDVTPKYCFFNVNQALGAMLYQFDTALYNYIPCILIFVANILILIAIVKSRNQKLLSTKVKSNEGKLLISLVLVSTLYVALLLPTTTVWTFRVAHQSSLSKVQVTFLAELGDFLKQVAILNYCIRCLSTGRRR
jgi:hypothetical protein